MGWLRLSAFTFGEQTEKPVVKRIRKSDTRTS